MNTLKGKITKDILTILIMSVIPILALGVTSVFLIIKNDELNKKVATLSEDVEKQHDNYVNCISNSIENKWLLEKYQNKR